MLHQISTESGNIHLRKEDIRLTLEDVIGMGSLREEIVVRSCLELLTGGRYIIRERYGT